MWWPFVLTFTSFSTWITILPPFWKASFFFDWLFFTNYMFKQLMGGASFVTVCAYGGHIRDSHSNIFGLINKSSAQLSLKSQTHLLFSLAQAKMAKRVFSQKDLSRGSSKKSQSRQYTQISKSMTSRIIVIIVIIVFVAVKQPLASSATAGHCSWIKIARAIRQVSFICFFQCHTGNRYFWRSYRVTITGCTSLCFFLCSG